MSAKSASLGMQIPTQIKATTTNNSERKTLTLSLSQETPDFSNSQLVDVGISSMIPSKRLSPIRAKLEKAFSN